MPESPAAGQRLVPPAAVAEALSITVDEVIALVLQGRLRGVRAGAPATWRIEESSVLAYLDDQAEEVRRMALWRQSHAASFPELWGSGPVRNPD